MQLVLLIETDFYALKEYEGHLSGNRFRLVDTVSAKKGLEYARSAPPDLIIIGFQPQERDTVTPALPIQLHLWEHRSLFLGAITDLKKEPITKHIPVLALIPDLNVPFLEYLQKIGIAGYLPKPVKQNALVHKVNELLSISENIRANIIKETVHHVAVALNNDERVVIIFRSGIKNYVIPEIRRVINHDFIKNSINKHIAFDLRTLPEITLEEMRILEKILKLFGEKRIEIVKTIKLINYLVFSPLVTSKNIIQPSK